MDIQVYNNSLKRMYSVSKQTAEELKRREKVIELKNGSLVVFNDRTELRYYKMQLESIRDTCYICGEKTEIMTIEHIIPKCKDGIMSDENLELACKRCNDSKGRLSLTAFINLIKKNRDKFSYISNERIDELDKKYINRGARKRNKGDRRRDKAKRY